MQAITNFLNRAKAVRISHRHIKENTHAKFLKDTPHGKEIYDRYQSHIHGIEGDSKVFVGIGVNYNTHKMTIVEGLQSPDGQMSVYIDDKEFFQGTRLGYEYPDVRKIAKELLTQNTAELGWFETA